MAEIPEANEGGKMYLNKGKLLDEKKPVLSITIIDEAKVVDAEYQGKVTKKVQCTVRTNTGEELTWQMNKATQNWCRTKFGTDSLKWKDQTFEIQMKQVGSMAASIYPKELSLTKVITA